jgi:hypothetical protein
MKKRIALGVGMLLTLGTAVAGTLIYGNVESTASKSGAAGYTTTEVTPELIAMWKATASSADYVAPKAPI